MDFGNEFWQSVAWGQQFFSDFLHTALPDILNWPHLTLGEKFGEFTKIVLAIGGAFEFIKFIFYVIFKNKSIIQKEIEGKNATISRQENEIKQLDNKNKSQKSDFENQITELKAELAKTADKTLEVALETANHEWRDENGALAIRALETWANEHFPTLGDIAVSIAKFHIAEAIPTPKEHLKIASRMLKLAQLLRPQDKAAGALWAQFDAINYALHEQAIYDGQTQIGWNDGYATALKDKNSAPLINALIAVGKYCYEKALYQLAPLFVERASALAWSGGQAYRRLWFEAEVVAAWCYRSLANGRLALKRLDAALAVGKDIFTNNEKVYILARLLRLCLLCDLDLAREGQQESLDLFKIATENFGERDLVTLTARFYHARVMHHCNQVEKALLAYEDLLPIHISILGAQNYDVQATQLEIIRTLYELGRYDAALSKIDSLLPELKCMPIQSDHVLITHQSRVRVLINLNRLDEALAEAEPLPELCRQAYGEDNPQTKTMQNLLDTIRQRLANQSITYDEAQNPKLQFWPQTIDYTVKFTSLPPPDLIPPTAPESLTPEPTTPPPA